MRLKSPLTREALSIGYPIIVGMISTTIMNIVDIAMVGRLGAAAIAAVGLTGIFFFTISSFLSALDVGVQTVAARRYGEQEYHETGTVLWNALLIAVLTGVPATILGMAFGTKFIVLLNSDPQVVALGQDYIWYRFMGIGFVVISMAFHGFFNGIAKTKIHLKVTVVANALNVLLNYLLIFGKLGLPEMGVSGAGLASTIGMAYSVLGYAYFGLQEPIRSKFAFLVPARFKPDIIRKVVRLSIPVAIQNALVHAGFTAFLVIVGKIGTVALAASEIVFNILSFSFMPGYGFGLAAGTMVGKYLGALDPDKAEQSGWIGMRLTIVFMGVMGIVFILIPGYILRLFTTDLVVIREGIIALQILGAIQFVDAIGMSLAGALRGAGDTPFVGITEIIINLGLFLPTAYLFSITLQYGLFGAWIAFGVYIISYAGVMIFRFQQGRWKAIEV
ncbi:MAG: MATE family efflux transporter [Candidatus Marinimicrobia bacterium]|nr:MATE family efflux transporter [Candidatus Neomarinimicrobiota bacterium]MCF7828421.1 MATE family efflux transporter [Candidatus Neomarinimicrobiota bacterium]MCF7880985.1 MATE family efflux transporter [Candidatus Neomarinimicrobiota bacterium]